MHKFRIMTMWATAAGCLWLAFEGNTGDISAFGLATTLFISGLSITVSIEEARK